MQAIPLITVLFAVAYFFGLAGAERVDRVEVGSVDPLPEAVGHFSVSSHRLETLLAAEPDDRALAEIRAINHALGELNEQLVRLVDTLEERHTASGTYQHETVPSQDPGPLSAMLRLIE